MTEEEKINGADVNYSAAIMMADDDVLVDAEPLIPLRPESPKRDVRRIGVTEATNTALVIIKRKKKISINIPEFVRDAYRRLNRVYLSSKKYKHLLDEMIGGVYGIPSRPELELQKFEFICELPSDDGSRVVSQKLQLDIVYDYEQNLYIISRRVEDKLLLYLHQNRDRPLLAVDGLISSTSSEGLYSPVSHLDLYRQRMWRRLLHLYIAPLLKDPLRLNYAITFIRNVILSGEEEVLTPEGSEDGGWEFSSSSDDSSDDEKARKKKGKKGANKRKPTIIKQAKPGAGGATKAAAIKKSKSLKTSKSAKKGKAKVIPSTPT